MAWAAVVTPTRHRKIEDEDGNGRESQPGARVEKKNAYGIRDGLGVKQKERIEDSPAIDGEIAYRL